MFGTEFLLKFKKQFFELERIKDLPDAFNPVHLRCTDAKSEFDFYIDSIEKYNDMLIVKLVCENIKDNCTLEAQKKLRNFIEKWNERLPSIGFKPRKFYWIDWIDINVVLSKDGDEIIIGTWPELNSLNDDVIGLDYSMFYKYPQCVIDAALAFMVKVLTALKDRTQGGKR